MSQEADFEFLVLMGRVLKVRLLNMDDRQMNSDVKAKELAASWTNDERETFKTRLIVPMQAFINTFNRLKAND